MARVRQHPAREGQPNIRNSDRVWAENALLNALGLDSFTRPETAEEQSDLEPILAELIAYGVEHGLVDDSITEKDLFDSRLMGAQAS